MVNYFESDFARPIILGDHKESISAANLIKRKTTLSVTFVSNNLSVLNKIRFKHIIPSSESDDIVLLTLTDIPKHLPEYETPLLIYSKEHDEKFISENLSLLETLYILIPTEELKSFFEGI